MAENTDRFLTLDADTTVPQLLAVQKGRYSQIHIGEITAEDFGGGTLLIQTPTRNGGFHTIRSITEAQFAALQDKTIQLQLSDGLQIYVSLASSSSPDLYIEHRDQGNTPK